ncbi:MAG: hypothetical protein M1832_004520 [Thelocarpon impressellum]|nr:MAG: hypothetical protein M1832_004520 [Thelocarpon impressellum]
MPIRKFRHGISARPVRVWPQARSLADSSERGLAEEPRGPNQDVLPHVSEEAAATGDITGEGGPELDQGTPVQEILKRDPEGQEKAPRVIQEDISPSKEENTASSRFADGAVDDTEVVTQGVKFGMPELPLPSTSHLKHRYDPVVNQVTKLLMRDGKLSVAQTNMALILSHLRTSSPPAVSPARPLLPGAPPASHLPLNPVLYLTLAIDSVAPLLRIRTQKGAAGGGMALQIPIPLRARQRRRKAVEWILDAADKKKSRGSGKGQFAQRVAEEIVAVVEGKSGVWERRGGVHKLAVSARANLNYASRRR